MTFTAHPVACDFCVTKIVVVSEARNVELYIDGMYEKTTKGMMLTLRKGKLVQMLFSMDVKSQQNILLCHHSITKINN